MGSLLLYLPQGGHGPHHLLASTHSAPQRVKSGLYPGARVGSPMPLCCWESQDLGCVKESSRAFGTQSRDLFSENHQLESLEFVLSPGATGTMGYRWHPLHWAGGGQVFDTLLSFAKKNICSSPSLTYPQGSPQLLKENAFLTPKLSEPPQSPGALMLQTFGTQICPYVRGPLRHLVTVWSQPPFPSDPWLLGNLFSILFCVSIMQQVLRINI